jgi:hypothetical protein
LKLITLNKLFKVAFFTKLVINLTNKVNSYDFSYGYGYVLQTLEAVLTVSPQATPKNIVLLISK